MMKLVVLVVLYVLGLAAGVALGLEHDAGVGHKVDVGAFVVKLHDGALSVSRTTADKGEQQLVWESAGKVLELAATKMYLHGKDGMFDVKDDTAVCSSTSFEFSSLLTMAGQNGHARAHGVVQLSGAACPHDAVETIWTLRPATFSNGSLAVSVRLNDTSLCGSGEDVTSCRFTLHSSSSASEAVYGFGVQYSVWNMKGRVVPIIITEQGVGRGLQPLTSLLDLVSFKQGGNWHTTYVAMTGRAWGREETRSEQR